MITLEQLNEEQRAFVDTIVDAASKAKEKLPRSMSDRMFSLSGKSGSGKSTTTSVLIRELQKLDSRILVSSTTHKSLKVLKDMLVGTNISASTIHSYLKCKVVEDYTTGTYRLDRASDSEVEAVDILLVEESSMAGADLFEFIQQEMMKGKIGIIVFLGDSAQLKPVESGEFPIYQGLIPCYNHDLKTVMRQAQDSNILTIGNYIRSFIESGEFIPFHKIVEYIKTFKDAPDIEMYNRVDLWFKRYSELKDENCGIGCHKNVTANLYNSKARLIHNNATKLPFILEGEELVFLEAHTEGDEVIHQNNEVVKVVKADEVEDELNDLTYWRCTTSKGSSFKVLDKASQMSMDDQLKQITKEAKKATGAARTALWEKYFRLKNSFQKVTYTYAATDFKQQGSSYDNIFVDLNELLEASKYLDLDSVYRLSYVIITRSRYKAIFLC